MKYMFLYASELLLNAFDSKIIKRKQRLINLVVYISLIRTHGEITPSAGLELLRNPTSHFHWELGLGGPLSANTYTLLCRN